MELTNLVNEFRAKAGFELFAWAGGRPDLNDYHDLRGDQSNYVRAIHNIKAVHGTASRFDHEINSILNAYVGKDCKHNVIFLGRLPRTTLDQAINSTQSNQQTGFIRLTINAPIRDSEGRLGSSPHVNLVGPVDLLQKVFTYLIGNPDQYRSFIEALLPEQKYPNSHRGIIKQMQPITKVYFVTKSNLEQDDPYTINFLKKNTNTSNLPDIEPEIYERSKGIIKITVNEKMRGI